MTKRKNRKRKPHALSISPGQAEFMMQLRRYQLKKGAGATAEELAELMTTTVNMIRKYASKLSNSTPKYVDAYYPTEKRIFKTDGGEELEKDVNCRSICPH